MSAQKSAGDFGRKLREARERRGLSLRQIANATKISVPTLEALERNDITRLPGGIFSRGVVRSYALEVGLEPESTIDEFMGQFPHDSVTAGHPTTAQIEDHEAVESDRRMATAFLRLVLISVPVAAMVIYFATHGLRSITPAPPRAEGPGTPAVKPAPAAAPVPALAPAAPEAAPAAPAAEPAPSTPPAP
jgi:cytoskeleton protein RodZ